MFSCLIVVLSLIQASLSLPGSPFAIRRSSKGSQFSWKKPKHSGPSTDRQPLVPMYLGNLNLPFADDSAAVTPTSDDLCNMPIQNRTAGSDRRSSLASHRRHPDGRQSRRSSFASQNSRTSRNSRYSFIGDKKYKETNKLENPWNRSKTRGDHLLPEVIVDKSKLEDNVSYVASACDVYSFY